MKMSICELGNKCVMITDSKVCLMTNEISVARLSNTTVQLDV